MTEAEEALLYKTGEAGLPSSRAGQAGQPAPSLPYSNTCLGPCNVYYGKEDCLWTPPLTWPSSLLEATQNFRRGGWGRPYWLYALETPPPCPICLPCLLPCLPRKNIYYTL